MAVKSLTGVDGNGQSTATNQSFTAVTTEQILAAFSIPKNTMKVGSTYRLHVEGYMTQTGVASNMVLSTRCGSAAGVAAGTAAQVAKGGWSQSSARAAIPFSIDSYVTCRSTGGSGTMLGGINHYGEYVTGGESSPGVSAVTAAQTVDTTADLAIAITMTPSVATITAVNVTVSCMERVA